MQGIRNGIAKQPRKFFLRLWPVYIFTLIGIGLGVKLAPFAKLHDAVFIVSLCIILFAFSISYGLKFILSPGLPPDRSKLAWFNAYKYELGLILIIIITTLPLLFKSYFYYDDWTLIGNPFFPCKQNLIILGRPFQVLFFTVLDKTNITNAYIFKWVFIFALILYSIVLYRWLLHLSHNQKLSFFFSAILSVFAPVMDLLGYTAIGVITYALLFSALSVVAFTQAYAAYQRRKIWDGMLQMAISVLLLFTACLTYQLGPQIIFLFLAIELFLSAQPRLVFRKHLAFLLVFAFSFGAYLLFIKTLTQINNFDIISDRSQMIHSIEQVIGKFNFYQQVFKQGIMQIGTALSGNAFLLERYHGYYISYSNTLAGNLLYYFICLVFLAAFIDYGIKARSILGLIGLALYLPMSYFSFLLLSESEYLVGYAFAHISLLMFFFIMGLVAIFRFFIKLLQRIRSRPTAILAENNIYLILLPILLACAWVSSTYVRDFYIHYNSRIYATVKDEIRSALESGELQRIHVAGLISPINADIYSLFVVQTALKELGEDIGAYKLTYSRNTLYLARIEDGYYRAMSKLLSAGELSFLDSFYSFDPTYAQHNLNRLPSAEEASRLSAIFTRIGAIPLESSSDTLLIDLTWTDAAYYNQH